MELYLKRCIDSLVTAKQTLGDTEIIVVNDGSKDKSLSIANGYKELYPYFDNKYSLEDSLELIKKNSRHYANRQYTFFNNQFDNINWIETNYDDFSKTISQAITVIDNK